MYKINVPSNELEQILIGVSNNFLEYAMTLEDLTKINNEFYKKVYKLVSEYNNEIFEFKFG